MYYEENKEDILNKQREKYKVNKYKKLKKTKEHNNQLCYDPIKCDKCTYCALRGRISRNKEKYKNVILQNCIIKNDEIIS